MKKQLATLTILLLSSSLFSQKSKEEVQEIRLEHAMELADTSHGVLNQDEIDKFQGLDYFAFEAKYQITGAFTKDKGPKFEMPTSTERKPLYRRYGYVDFEFEGARHRLEVYQNIELKRNKKYKDYLFIPFRDGTSAKETYGGGRYLDARIPEGTELILDFNLAYNPYCSYSYRYSCPIPPAVNTLTFSILAGEKTPLGH